MKTLRTTEYAHSVRRGLLWLWAGITLVGLLLGFLLPGRPFASAIIGVCAASAIIAMSALSISKMVQSEDLGVIWLVLDYVVKVGAIAVAILVPKVVGGFNLGLIAGIVTAAILATLALQLAALQRFSAKD